MRDFERCRKILGVGRDAGPEEIKQAYRDLVRIWHPDRFHGDIRLQQKAQEQLKDINSAYRKLIRNNPDRERTGPGPAGAESARPVVEYRRTGLRFLTIRRAAVLLFIMAGCGFLLASVRSELAEIPYNLGFSYLEAGHCDEALKAYRVARWLNPDSAKILYALGNAYYRSGLYGQAEKAYAQVMRINPHYEEVQRRMAVLSARREMHEGSGIR